MHQSLFVKNKKLLLVFSVAILLFVTHAMFSGHAQALGANYFDDSGATCDVSGCASTEISLVVGETQFVQRTGVFVRAYFKGNAGEVTITNRNFCPGAAAQKDDIQNNDWFDTARAGYAAHTIASGTQITKFTIGGTAYYGYKYSAASASCSTPLVVKPALTFNANIGLWYADINIDPLNLRGGTCSGATITNCDGILNYFTITETGAVGSSYEANRYAITQVGGASGYEVTAQEETGADNIDYFVRFGSDCTVNANIAKSLSYYDMDNKGGGGAQLNGKITMKLYDVTGGGSVLMSSWTPGDNNNTLEQHGFTAGKDKKYLWTIENVYRNNVLQFSTPFDGIFALRTCAPPAPPVLSVSAVGDVHEKGDGVDKHITYALNVAASACVGNKTIIWGGDGGAPDTTSVVPCGTAASYAGSQATVPAATLDAWPNVGAYGAYFGRIRSIDGVASAIVSPTSASIGVYEVPYSRFNGNDIYACGGSGVAAIDGRIVFNVSGADTSKGAAVEYAALALSGFGLNTVATSPDITTALGHGAATALKGSLASGTNSPCGTDPSGYYPSTVTGAATANIPAAAGYYTTSGNLSITGGTTTKKVTIHATGNITITGNNIGASGAPASPFVDDNNVPYVLIIADGDILIDPSVTTINAVLVAGGTISTCSVGNLANPSSANLDTSCRSTLTINGAMSAKNILYRRSIGTRLLNNAPAEVVNFPPYLHFATPFLDDTSSAGYQSLFNAAPYL